MTLYPWLVFVHIFGVLLFAFGHGTSSVVAFKVRGERERARIAALLEVSQVSTGVMYVGLLVLLGVQMAVGETQYRNGLPWWLVLIHVTVAACVFAWTVGLVARLWRPVARNAD